MELLLGCGNSRRKRIWADDKTEWSNVVTLDIDPNCKPDVLWDLNLRPLPFEENTFDEIHATHLLEHLGQQGSWRSWLDEWSDYWRILKPGGYFFGVTPSISSPWLWGDIGHTRVVSQETLVFLNQDQYKQQVGITSMTDYRAWYKADFQLVKADTNEEEFLFVLQAVKPSRIELK